MPEQTLPPFSFVSLRTQLATAAHIKEGAGEGECHTQTTNP